jgi:hypothetical protein
MAPKRQGPAFFKVAVTLSAEAYAEAQRLLIETARAGRRVSMSGLVEIALDRLSKLPSDHVSRLLKGARARRSAPKR